ncbi:hypothetical protein [Streptomyces sp. WP-1]|uniref:hypothetical protein n=1 Tax=Streptomyces sp. WP-1 TaxID=3041497 RepID=UPI00264882AE|nr:hypothetical protein [Streptomyces sp. WP-1]WKE70202.1 hypothetical protein QHG49_14705 [Streptomyces sp. WP-1]
MTSAPVRAPGRRAGCLQVGERGAGGEVEGVPPSFDMTTEAASMGSSGKPGWGTARQAGGQAAPVSYTGSRFGGTAGSTRPP